MTWKAKAFLLFGTAALLAVALGGGKETNTPELHRATLQTPPQTTLKEKVRNIMAFVSAGNSKAAYEARLAKVMEGMPTLTEQRLPEHGEQSEIHGFLAEEFAEGHKLAQLRRLSLENEAHIESTQNTYASCAEREDLAESVRAICFMRAMEISIKLKNPEHIVALNVPANVRELALKLVN